MILIVSGIDASFELSHVKLYGLMFKLNILVVIFALVFVGFVIYVGSLLDDVLSVINDTVQKYLFFITLLIAISSFKYWLFLHNELLYTNYILIIASDIILLTVPVYIVAKILQVFGKAFQH